MMTMHVILLLLISCISVNTHYSLYHSHISHTSYPTFDCLYAYLIDVGKEIGSRYIRNYHLIPYCRRPDINEKQEQITYIMNENIRESISFGELKKQGITSQQLLEWFVPIDIAEKYEMNTNDFDVFYNCSLPWFGSKCQYQFKYNSSLSFGNIVEINFENYPETMHNITIGTCYRFLNGCNNASWPLCLDWREICDGKIDCVNGEDEEWCNELEMTKCNDDEYRCHYGGQCIPLAFVKDSRLSIDCLDGSDEQDYIMAYISLGNVHCTNIQTFRCQERIGRYPRSFQCGDGQYLRSFNLPSRATVCSNRRDIEFSRAMLTSLNHILDNDCREAFHCALYCNRTQEIGKNTRK
jgi:hypothetical protein